MSDISFREIFLDEEPDVASEVVALIENELGGERHISALKRTIDYGSGNTKFIGGFFGSELVTTSAFVRLEFSCGDRIVFGYENGLAATSKSHAGKGFFSKLMLFSEGLLHDRGGAFIFGFPNPFSRPILVGRLGYTQMNLYSCKMLCLPALRRLNFDMAAASRGAVSKSGLTPRSHDNISWKRRAADTTVETHAYKGSMLWGKKRVSNKFGLKANFLDIGGIDLDRAEDLPKLVELSARAAGVALVHICLNEENECFPLLRSRHSGMAHTIIKSLTPSFAPAAQKVNFFGGMSDTF